MTTQQTHHHQEDSMETYTTRGSVRGGCGHQHRTISGALRCLDRDQRACRGLGGGAYSDRELVGPDGTIPTTRDDDGDLIVDEETIRGAEEQD